MRKYWEGWKNSAAIYWRGGGDRFRGMLGKHSNLHFKTGHSHFTEIFACLSFPVFLRNILRGIFLNIYHRSGGHNKAHPQTVVTSASSPQQRLLESFARLYTGRLFLTVHTSVLPYFGAAKQITCLLGYLGTRVPPVGEYLGTACEGSSVPGTLICTLSPSSTTLKARTSI